MHIPLKITVLLLILFIFHIFNLFTISFLKMHTTKKIIFSHLFPLFFKKNNQHTSSLLCEKYKSTCNKRGAKGNRNRTPITGKKSSRLPTWGFLGSKLGIFSILLEKSVLPIIGFPGITWLDPGKPHV